MTDGDTIVLASGQRVRYIGINAPETDHEDQKAQPYGNDSRSLNKNLVMSQKVRLEFDDERYDQYGRMLAYIFLQDGSFLNARLLKAGLAFYLYRAPNVRYEKILLKSQQDAMDSQKGLWRNWKEKNAKPIIGNLSSRRFHNSSCSYAKKIKSKNRMVFPSKWDAFRAGYAPSKKCIVEFWSYEAGK
ncbi:MAG: thermonuclease family protein [Deltaproteobacteria bacterium]|nr:thermonuclease family protein [Deltaproteobacteria bacterium]